jgi:hypothetical protein
MRGNTRKVCVSEKDPAGVRQLEASEESHERALAATGRPQQSKELTFEYRQREVVDCDNLPEALADVLQANERRATRAALACGKELLMFGVQRSWSRLRRREPNQAF